MALLLAAMPGGGMADARHGAEPDRPQARWWTAGCWSPRGSWWRWRKQRRKWNWRGRRRVWRTTSWTRRLPRRCAKPRISNRRQTGRCGSSMRRFRRPSARIAARRERIAKLEKDAPRAIRRRRQLELAKAQLALDENELEDAQLDLARQGGDERGKLEQAAQEHTAAQQ